MQNDEGKIVDLYIPRKCSATNRLITAKDHASVQIEICQVSISTWLCGIIFCERFYFFRLTKTAEWTAAWTPLSLLLASCAKEARPTLALTDSSLRETSSASVVENNSVDLNMAPRWELLRDLLELLCQEMDALEKSPADLCFPDSRLSKTTKS